MSHGNTPEERLPVCKIVELDLLRLTAKHCQRRIDGTVVLAVLEQQVPFALLRAPTLTHGPLGHLGCARGLVPHEELPLAVLFLGVPLEAPRPQELARAEATLDGRQLHQEGPVGVLLLIVEEEGHLLLVVEFREDHVVHSHPEGTILPLVHRHPLIGVLGHLVEVRAEDHHLGAVVARFRREVAVRRARHVQVAAHDREKLRVVPIRALLHIRLFAPHFGAAGRQVTVPVVEAKVGAAHELDETRTCGVAQHGHGGNGTEARDAIGAVGLDGVDVGRSHELVYLLPGGAAEASLPPGLLIARPLDRIVLDTGPGSDRILILALGLVPEVHQRPAHVGELHAEGAVEVPGEADAALAATWLVGRDRLIQERVVHHLHLPGDDAFLDVDVPTATASAVHAVGAAHHLVVRPAVPVELLPGAGFGVYDVGDPVALLTLGHGDSVSSCLDQALGFRFLRTPFNRFRPRWPPSSIPPTRPTTPSTGKTTSR